MDAEEKIVRSYNLWIDTVAHERRQEKGDYFTLALGSQPIDADSGQFIRLTLNNFYMPKVWNTINRTNNLTNLKFINFPAIPTGQNQPTIIPHNNYRNIYDLAEAYMDNVVSSMQAWEPGGPTFTPTLDNPPITATIPGTTDNIIQFTIEQNIAYTGSPAVPDIAVQMFAEDGESYIILGGDRLNANQVNGTSWDVELIWGALPPAAPGPVGTYPLFYRFKARYPALRTSQPYIFLRTALSNFSVETSTYAEPPQLVPPSADVNTSAIMAKIPVMTEAAVYDSNYGREYFLNIYNRHISNVFLYITDERNRPLGRLFGSQSLTACGTGDNQSTLGNLYFNAVIRVDVIQQTLPQEKLFEPIPNPLNPKTSGLLLNPDEPLDDSHPDKAMRALTISQHSKSMQPVRKAGGMIGRGY